MNHFDSISKIGTKKSALINGDPVANFSDSSENNVFRQEVFANVKEYLTRVWSGMCETSSKNLNKLRFKCYSQGRWTTRY